MGGRGGMMGGRGGMMGGRGGGMMGGRGGGMMGSRGGMMGSRGGRGGRGGRGRRGWYNNTWWGPYGYVGYPGYLYDYSYPYVDTYQINKCWTRIRPIEAQLSINPSRDQWINWAKSKYYTQIAFPKNIDENFVMVNGSINCEYIDEYDYDIIYL